MWLAAKVDALVADKQIPVSCKQALEGRSMWSTRISGGHSLTLTYTHLHFKLYLHLLILTYTYLYTYAFLHNTYTYLYLHTDLSVPQYRSMWRQPE